MKELIIFKLGGSAITNKKKFYSIKIEWIDQFLKTLRKYLKKYKFIIVHGGGSFAHPVVESYGLKKRIDNDNIIGISITEALLKVLNVEIIKLCIRNSIPIIPLSTNNIFIKIDKKLRFKCKLIEECLEKNLIPILHGDLIFDNRKKFTILSGDDIVLILSKKFKPKHLNKPN